MKIQDLVAETYTLEGTGRYLRSLEHNSLVVDTQKNLFYWNSKNIYGDAYVWLTRIMGYPDEIARKRIADFKAILTPEIVKMVTNVQRNSDDTYDALAEIFWNGGQKTRDYWYKRLITDKTIDRYKLGYYEGWFSIPFFVDDKLKNIQMRRDEPEKRIKSWYRGKKPVLFNSDLLDVTRTVIITEGPVDAMLLLQYGFPAISHNGGAGVWLPEWFKRFAKVKTVYVVYDNDKAGVAGAKKVAKNLGEYRCKLLTYEGNREGYDTVDFFREGHTDEEFNELLENETKRSFEYGE